LLELGSFKGSLYPVAIQAQSTFADSITLQILKGGKRTKEENEKINLFCRNNNLNYITNTRIPILISIKTILVLIGNVIRHPTIYWLRFWKDYYYDLAAVFTYLSKTKPRSLTICALTSTYHSGIFAKIIARCYKAKYIVWEHQSHYRQIKQIGFQRRALIRSVINSAEHFMPVSASLAETIVTSLGVSGHNFRILPNFISDEFFEEPENYPSWLVKLGKEKFVFASWANWREIKRLDLLVGAFRQFIKIYPESLLIIAGKIAESQFEELSIAGDPSIYFAGALNGENIKALAYFANCCVITSEYETFNLPTLESIAAGRPVISTKCGGPEIIIANDRFGRIADKLDETHIAKAMEDVYLNYSKFSKEDLQDHARKNFGMNAFYKNWHDVYKFISN
jgi:glycosyltransferase involved in cell wall biosynthesis